MAQSQNTKVDYTCKASFMNGLTSTGSVIVGDRAFEYYNERNVEDFVQIPWEEVDYVSAEVLPGKYISRFAIFTRRNGHFTFSAKDNKALIRAIRDYGHIPPERLQKSPNFFQTVGHGLMFLPHFVKEKLGGGKKGASEDARQADAKAKTADKGRGSSTKKSSSKGASPKGGSKGDLQRGPGVTRNRHFSRKR